MISAMGISKDLKTKIKQQDEMKPVIFRDEHVFVYIVMIIYGKWIYCIYIYTVYSNGICHGDRKKNQA